MPEFKRRERKHRKRAKSTTEDVQTVGKKQKRLDKYIETKLKKEGNLALLKNLAAKKVDTSLLQSSKALGKQRISKKDALSQALRNQRAGIADEGDLTILYEPERKKLKTNSTSNLIFSAGAESIENPVQISDSTTSSGQASGVEVGSGLKRRLENDENGRPILRKRQRLNKIKQVEDFDEESSWDGFDMTSEDSQSDDELSASEDSSSYSNEDSDEAKSFAVFSRLQSQAQQLRIKPRVQSDFKTWATQQINEAKDFQPSTSTTTQTVVPIVQPKLDKLRPIEQDPLPPELVVKSIPVSRQMHSVQVNRSAEIQESRLKLPIVAEEQKIMEAIHNNSTVIVCGATGSGKTTQIPQFLYEAGYGDPDGPTPGLIGVTQPRRVAAVTMARRVGEELGKASKSAYQIRFGSSIGPDTAIKFMTDGILLREISADLALAKYSAIIIDEAHERSVNTDILIGMLSRIVDAREKLSKQNNKFKPLKLIIMSATLMTDSFLGNPRLFPNEKPPLVESEGRQYPVTMHFSRRTQQDYIGEACQKVVKGHKKLPPGGMLVFMTGQNEISDLTRRLRTALKIESKEPPRPRVKANAREAPLENDDLDLDERLADVLDLSDDESGIEDEDEEFNLEEGESQKLKPLILPLYSQLPTKEQLKAFEPVPADTRVIILATNIAETSITIPGIRYVFDSGRVKEMKYHAVTGVQSFEINWISKASAMQRAGRAGRTGPGHCYRLYSSAMYERDFADHTTPEILRAPIEGVVLQLKSMGLDNITNFPFPTSPSSESIIKAERLLSHLGALDKDGKVTDLGRDLSLYPIAPRFAKMLAIGNQYDSIYHVTAMVAALAVPELFVPQARAVKDTGVDEDESEFGVKKHQEAMDERRSSYDKAQSILCQHDTLSDAVKMSVALCGYMWAKDPLSFCKEMFLNSKAMKEASDLYSQLLRIIADHTPGTIDPKRKKLQPPSATQVTVMKQVAAAGFLDQIALRADLAPRPPDLPKSSSAQAINVPYLTLFPTHEGRTGDAGAQVVFVHPSSVMANSRSAKVMPQYINYSHIQQGNVATIGSTKTAKNWMYPLTSVPGQKLASLAKTTSLLEYGRPIGKIEAVESGASDERIAWVVPSLIGERGGRCWPLPAVKTLQKRDRKGVWNVETVYK